jgi:hypothetical protein
VNAEMDQKMMPHVSITSQIDITSHRRHRVITVLVLASGRTS